ncbi:MAG: hypothetical protein H7838_06155 [Magnetococcus sp. DMHC-8]
MENSTNDEVIPVLSGPRTETTGLVPVDGPRDHPPAPRKTAAHVKVPAREAGHAKETGGAKRPGRLVGVRVPAVGMVYRLLATQRELKPGDAVLLQGREEETVGWVVSVVEGAPGETFQDRIFAGGYERIIRVLSESERHFLDNRAELERQARLVCREKIRELQLPMRLSGIRYLPGGGKVVVYFTAENRVDFRELVRILGSHLKVRVEMRHIGVRDETRLLGGIGLCGHEFCCSVYLRRFHPVSVRMAKNQELSLNPEGISGTCGRLLCCLEYENATYQALREGMPRPKQTVQVVDGREGVVQSVHPLMGTVDLQLADGSRACVARCDLCGHNGGSAVVEEEALPGDAGVLCEGAPAAVVTEAGRRLAGATARGQAGRSPPPKRESGREQGRARPAPSAAVPATVDAARPVGPEPASSAPGGEGLPPARKRRRRRRSAAVTATGQKAVS